MSRIVIPGGGLWFPGKWYGSLTRINGQLTFDGVQASPILDAAGEMVALIGYIFIDGRPASAKTLSSAGGKIHWRPGAVTFANASTNLRIGVQDVSTSAGPVVRPDENWTGEPQDDLVGGTDTITANVFNTVTLSSGSRNIAHGDLIAVVFDMTARGGTDSVAISGVQRGSNSPGTPAMTAKTGGAWEATAKMTIPHVVIEFDDGTLGWFDPSVPIESIAVEQYNNDTNPDERGMVFQVPFDCGIDMFSFARSAIHAVADYDVKLYSDPLGTPTVMTTVSLLGERGEHTSTTPKGPVHVPTPAGIIQLSKNVDYALALKANGAGANGDLRIPVWTFSNANFRKAMPNGATMAYATRNGDTGAFTTTTTKLPEGFGVRICEIDDGRGIGSAGLHLALR